MLSFITIGNTTYAKVYTDGSCHEGDNPDVARAGWGTFFAKDSKHNFSAPLDGPVQTSYRAELKAVIHVIRKTATPTVIMCDCQSVVKTFNKFIHSGIPSQGLREQDLWEQVYVLMENTTDNMVLMQWMPGHLDDKTKVQKRDKMLKDGTILMEDIDGNVQADKLANTGTGMHLNIDEIIKQLHDKQVLTILVQ